jgi:hypothetical protein
MKSGEAGEKAFEYWAKLHGWHMSRSQPPCKILAIMNPAMIASIKRFSPRLAAFGHMVIARLGKGGIADFTGYQDCPGPNYRAVEVKEVAGDTMPASRLDKAQREFLGSLPDNSAYVGILWQDGLFEVHPFIEKGSYKKGSCQVQCPPK